MEHMFFELIEDGEVKTYQLLCRFTATESGRKYMIYVDPSDVGEGTGNVECIASAYTVDENGNYTLEEITTDEEWEMIDEVLDQLNNG